MKQFKSFKDFIQKIDKHGMKSGIVKVVPPKEWYDLPTVHGHLCRKDFTNVPR